MTLPRYQELKDSGIDYLGAIPSTWSIKRLGDIVSFAQGKAHEPYIDDDGDYICVNSRFVSTAGKTLKKCTVNLTPASLNDILMVMSDLPNGRALARAYYVRDNGKYAVNQRVCRITAEKADSSFLFYLLDRHPGLMQNDDGVHQTHLSNDDFLKLKLYLPSFSEQIQIARFLDHETARIDALIAEQQRLIELLKENRQAVISHAVTKGLDPAAPMKHSGVEWLGEVPAHWRAVRLRHCLVDALTYGANEPSDEANLEHPRYIRITDLNDDGTLSAETYKSLPPEKAEPYMLEEGDVLFARSGATVGKSFLYSREYGPACYAGYLIRARVNKRALIPMYLWMCTQSRQYEQFIGESNIQATIQNVSAEKYGNMWIALPEIEEQEKILAELEIQLSQFKSLMETSVGALVLLQERRSALISAAVTGKIDVRGWQPPFSTQAPESAVAEAH